jgi:hypothetical protein
MRDYDVSAAHLTVLLFVFWSQIATLGNSIPLPKAETQSPRGGGKVGIQRQFLAADEKDVLLDSFGPGRRDVVLADWDVPFFP